MTKIEALDGALNTSRQSLLDVSTHLQGLVNALKEASRMNSMVNELLNNPEIRNALQGLHFAELANVPATGAAARHEPMLAKLDLTVLPGLTESQPSEVAQAPVQEATPVPVLDLAVTKVEPIVEYYLKSVFAGPSGILPSMLNATSVSGGYGMYDLENAEGLPKYSQLIATADTETLTMVNRVTNWKQGIYTDGKTKQLLVKNEMIAVLGDLTDPSIQLHIFQCAGADTGMVKKGQYGLLPLDQLAGGILEAFSNLARSAIAGMFVKAH